jgi:UDP-3-O-[3-hydroxymyristoyl] glucosamine N-acyltransferase
MITPTSAFVRTLARPVAARDLARALGAASVVGEPGRLVHGIGSLAAEAADVLTFCDASNAADRLTLSRAAVVIVPNGVAAQPRADQTLICVDDVRAAFIDAVELLLPRSARPDDPRPGIAASARVDPTAAIAEAACIGEDVVIGARTRVAPGAIVYADTWIGDDCVIGPNAVIGWVGLAYHDRRNGQRSFFPHLAGVRIGNGVDIGAHGCVCRGMLSHTTIGHSAKIGSLVYVSHGVIVEARAWLSAATAVAGHASIADNALLGIGSVVIDNVTIHEGVLVGGGSVVTKDAAAGSMLYGVPAHPVPRMRRFGPTPRD